MSRVVTLGLWEGRLALRRDKKATAGTSNFICRHQVLLG
jgi:hypothetical protein